MVKRQLHRFRILGHNLFRNMGASKASVAQITDPGDSTTTVETPQEATQQEIDQHSPEWLQITTVEIPQEATQREIEHPPESLQTTTVETSQEATQQEIDQHPPESLQTTTVETPEGTTQLDDPQVSEKPSKKPLIRLGPWSIFWLIVFAILGITGLFGLWLLTTLPPEPDCKNPSSLSTESAKLYCAQM